MNGIALRNIRTIVGKELRGYADSAAMYIVVIIFLLLWQFLFFRDAFIVGEASLSQLFTVLPWMFLLLIPAITMGSISQEKSEGTLEFLLTHPMRDRELLLGKFCAAAAIAAGVLLFAFPIAAMLARHGNLDWGIVIAQYLASVCMASVLIALGIMVSTLLASQMSALLLSAAGSFLLITAGMDLVSGRLPTRLASIAEQLSVSSHFNSMARGVIDLRDLWYFATITGVFLAIAYLQLLRRRYGARTELFRVRKIQIFVFIALAITTNLLGSSIPGRIDVTEGGKYSLSAATKDIVSELEKDVSITLYVSGQLPAQLQPTLRDVQGMLRDYQTAGSGHLTVKTKDPKSKESIATEAQEKGVQEVQFNVVADEEFKVKKGYFGIVVARGDKHETIPVIQQTGDLEYQLTSFIQQLTSTNKKKIVFSTGHGERNAEQEYPTLYNDLGRQYSVQSKEVAEKIPAGTDVLIVANPIQKLASGTIDAINEYLDDGGAALVMSEQVLIDQQGGKIEQNKGALNDLLGERGITIDENLAYDLRSNVNANFNTGGGMSVQLPYPLFLRTVALKDHSATKGLDGVLLPWASSVSIDEDKLDEQNLVSQDLLTTTEFAGALSGEFSINPQQQFSQEDLGEKVVAVALQGNTKKSGAKDAPRLIVLGDADVFADGLIQQSTANIAFGMQAVGWLSQEASLASIKVKNAAARSLTFEEKSDTRLVKYGNLGLAALFPAAFGLWRLVRRRRLSRRTWNTRLESRKSKKAQS